MFMKSNNDPKRNNEYKYIKDAAVPFCQCLKTRKGLVAFMYCFQGDLS